MIFTVINIGTGYLNRPNWLLAGYSVYHRVASQGFPVGFPAHNVYDRPANSGTVRDAHNVYDRPANSALAAATVRAGRPQCLDDRPMQILAPAAVRAVRVARPRNSFSHDSSGPPVRTHLHTANQSYMI